MDEEAVVGLWAADIITFVYWSAYLLLQMNFFTLMSWSCDLLCIYSRLSSASICVYVTRWGTVIRSCKTPLYPSSFLFLRIGLLTEFRGLRLMFRSWILILASCSAWACWIPATTAWNDTSTNTVLINQRTFSRLSVGSDRSFTLSIIIWADGRTLSRASVQLSQGWAKTPSIVNLSSGFTFRSLTAAEEDKTE